MLDDDSGFAEGGQADNEHSPKRPSPLKSVHETPERKRRSTSVSIVLDDAGDPAEDEQAGSKRLRYYKQPVCQTLLADVHVPFRSLKCAYA